MEETVKDWLNRVADTNTSTELDSRMMENMLRRVGFPLARVVIGIVYLEGYGPPIDIHTMAKMFRDKLEAELAKREPANA